MDFPFGEFVDWKRVKALMRLFYDLTGFASTVIDVSGAILHTEDGEMMGIGWQPICLHFHRAHPATRGNCRRSDADMAAAVGTGHRTMCYHCPNGLMDAVAPVVVEGRHLFNLFIGQFLLEAPDEDAFRRRARRYGFDESEYIADLRRVPVFSRSHVERGLAFLELLAGLIVEMGQNRRRLMDLERAKTQFLALVSHELRTPLQNLEITHSLLARAAPPDPEIARLVAGMAAATERMGRVVDSILHHSLIETGRVAVDVAETRLDRLAAEVVAEMGERAAAKGLTLEMELPPLPPLATDPRLVRSALLTLVDNAVKYTERGRVRVAVSRDGERQRCVVADTGTGIRPEDHARIFQPFEQGEAVSHKHAPGVGLGLTLARMLAERLGGSIELASRPGAGSVFSLILPQLARGPA